MVSASQAGREMRGSRRFCPRKLPARYRQIGGPRPRTLSVTFSAWTLSMPYPVKVLTLAIVSWTLLVAGSFADAPDAKLGMVKKKPDKGLSVAVEGGFMVPYTATIPGTEITFEMIPVPGGTFKFGSPDSQENRKDDEGPQIEVVVDPMWVAKTEVTWAQYWQYMGLYAIFKEFEISGRTRGRRF